MVDVPRPGPRTPRDRRPFSPRTGLPDTETTEGEMITWYEHARAYAEAKWVNLAPVSRRSVAEALVTVTTLTAKEPGTPEAKVLRQALFAWAFNPATRDTNPSAGSPTPSASRTASPTLATRKMATAGRHPDTCESRSSWAPCDRGPRASGSPRQGHYTLSSADADRPGFWHTIQAR
jgi:hypothetical protein